ncbi:IclR family transcriptional regulator C-terminal domain-containing protein [Nocardia sp. NPDC059246]|uniref:IclR family transcriptional regulator domain-containing protein n=1 Tax=unclassified Nocardia TaxID=2637762 RepID=UPI00368AF9E4
MGKGSVLHRAVEILKLFDPVRSRMSLTEIASAAGLPLPTTYRITRELIDLGILERDQDKRYLIGTELWEIGIRSSPVLQLREIAMPYMEDLQMAVKQHTALSVRVAHEVLVLERLASHNEVSNLTQVGGRLPLHASSPGHILLAYADPALQERILAGPLERYTEQTITSSSALRTALAAVRMRGYAVVNGATNPYGGGIAVGIHDNAGEVVAALSTTYSLDNHNIVVPAVVSALLTAARSISRGLLTQPRLSRQSKGHLKDLGLDRRQGAAIDESHVISNDSWAWMEPLLPDSGSRRATRWRDQRQLMEAIAWKYRIGGAWREIPEERFGPWQTAYERLNKWRADGTWARLIAVARSDGDFGRELDWLVAADSSRERTREE